MKEKTKEDYKEIETKDGFKCVVNVFELRSYETLELFMDLDQGKIGALRTVLLKLLGEKYYNEMKDFLKNKNGVILTEDVEALMVEIIDIIKEKK